MCKDLASTAISIWTQIIPKWTISGLLGRVFPENFGNIKAQGLFCDLFSLSSFTVKVSSPHELHTDFRPPVAYSLSHSFLIYVLLTATVASSCHPSRLYPPSTLLSIRIITKPFYQIFRTRLGPVHIFPGLVLRPLSSFLLDKLFFLRVFCRSFTFFCPQKTTRPEITAASPNIQVSYTVSSI